MGKYGSGLGLLDSACHRKAKRIAFRRGGEFAKVLHGNGAQQLKNTGSRLRHQAAQPLRCYFDNGKLARKRAYLGR